MRKLILFLGISTTIFSQKKNSNIGILLDNRTEELDPPLVFGVVNNKLLDD